MLIYIYIYINPPSWPAVAAPPGRAETCLWLIRSCCIILYYIVVCYIILYYIVILCYIISYHIISYSTSHNGMLRAFRSFIHGSTQAVRV